MSETTRRLWEWIERDNEDDPPPVTRETAMEFRIAVNTDAMRLYEAGRHSVAVCTLDDAVLALTRLIETL